MARAYGTDSITVQKADFGMHPFAYAAVFGWRNVNFSIVASFEGTVTLLDGLPQRGEVPLEGEDYLTFQAPPGTPTDVTFTITPLNGMVGIYISGTQQPKHADESTYQWRSMHRFSGEVITVSKNDPHFPASGLFYLTIYGFTSSSYSAQATTTFTAQVLAGGIPVQGQSSNGQPRYFQTDVSNQGCSLDIVVTPITGDPDLYVSRSIRTPSRFNADRASNRFGGDDILYQWAEPGPYYIGVEAYRGTNSTFTIVAIVNCLNASDADYIYLINGVPQSGSLAKGEARYYRFDVLSSHVDVSISVTRKYGDPDLFVSTSLHGSGRASPDSYMWASMALGEDLITIDSSDPNFCSNCSYLITVFAAANTSYTLSASTSNHIVTLLAGVPFKEDLKAGEYEYFQFTVDSSDQRPITITVTDLGRGDPDLFVSTKDNFPNATYHMWAGQRLSGDSVTIPSTDDNYCSQCTYFISVRAFTEVTFTIVAIFGDTIEMQDGTPQTGVVPRGAMAYYRFHAPIGFGELSLTLTTTAGQSSLYVSPSDEVLPEISDYTTFTWFAGWYSSVKTLRIRDSDPRVCVNATTSCPFSIGVFGVNNSSFVLVASTTGTSMQLQNGIPTRRHIDTDGWAYFTFRVDTPGLDLSILATPISGDPDLYVSTVDQKPDKAHNNKSGSRWGFDVVDFPSADVGWYYIGVTAFRNATFDVTAILINSTGDDTATVVRLLEGEPFQRTVFKGHFVYFTYDARGSSLDAMTITLTKLFGDPDLYVTSDGSFPSTTNHQWSSSNVEDDVVQIDNPPSAVLKIGVNAFTTSAFVLTLSTSRGVTQLQEGIPLRAEQAARTYSYYKLHLDSNDANIPLTITVSPFSGDPDIYVATSHFNQRPNATSYQWAGIAYMADSVTIAPTNPNYCLCTYYVGVFSFSACSYSILAQFSNVTMLLDGVPTLGKVRKEQFVYYRFQIPEEATDVTFSVTPINGNPNLFVSTANYPELNSTCGNRRYGMWAMPSSFATRTPTSAAAAAVSTILECMACVPLTTLCWPRPATRRCSSRMVNHAGMRWERADMDISCSRSPPPDWTSSSPSLR